MNWSTDEQQFKKKHPKEYKLWRLTQLINYGLGNEKLNEFEIKAHWDKIKENLDPYKRRALEYLIWGKLYSLPSNLSFWNLPKTTAK